MEPAVVAALVGITGTVTVSSLAQWLAFKSQDKQLRHAEKLEFDADARGVLDAALATAYEARARLQHAADILINVLDQSAVEGGGIPRAAVEKLQASQAASDRITSELRLAFSRLTVRFGPSAILATYGEVVVAYMTARTDSGQMYSRLLSDLHAKNMPEGLHDDLAGIDAAVAAFAEAAHASATSNT